MAEKNPHLDSRLESLLREDGWRRRREAGRGQKTQEGIHAVY